MLPNPYLSYRLILKSGTLRNIMTMKGWRNYADVGRALGFTRQYIQMLDKTKLGVSSEFVVRLAQATGNTDKWYLFYEIAPNGVIDPNHPTWNQQKHLGQQPYEQYSSSANLRKKDYEVEEKK